MDIHISSEERVTVEQTKRTANGKSSNTLTNDEAHITAAEAQALAGGKGIFASEARELSDNFNSKYWSDQYRRIRSAAKRGQLYVVLQHAPSVEAEEALFKRLKREGYKTYPEAMFVGWYL